jgi:hypothetical protein
MEFVAEVDVAAGTFKVTELYKTTPQGLEALPVVSDNVAGSGPTDTVEVVTNSTSYGCMGTNSFCASVTVRSFYTLPVADVAARLTDINPPSNFALNSDGAQPGLPELFGVWTYGNLSSGGSATKTWAFFINAGSPNNFAVHGEVQGTPGDASLIGCSDASREGYTNLTTYPNIASCSGAWSIAGLGTTRSCAISGDDAPDPSGAGCAAVDICAAGWHICATTAELTANTGGANCGTDAASGVTFFASRAPTRNDSVHCNSGTLVQENIVGCGTVGQGTGSSCLYSRWLNQSCSSIGYLVGGVKVWQCTDGPEIGNVVKTDPTIGGVLCCKNP